MIEFNETMRTPTVFWSVTAAVIAATALVAMKTELFPVLSSTVTAGRQKSDFYLTVTSQLLRPAGQTFALKGRPVQLAMDPAGSTLAVLTVPPSCFGMRQPALPEPK